MPLLFSELQGETGDPERDCLPYRGEEEPPTLCGECGEVVEDGFGWLSDDLERILCTGCYLPHTRRARK